MHPTLTGQLAEQHIAELHQQAEYWRVYQLQPAVEVTTPRRWRLARLRLSFGRSRPVAA